MSELSWDIDDLRVIQTALRNAAATATFHGIDFLDWVLDSDGYAPPTGQSPTGFPYVWGSVGFLDAQTYAKNQCGAPSRSPDTALEINSQGPLQLDARQAIMTAVETGLHALPAGYWPNFHSYHPPTGQPVANQTHPGYYAILARIRIHASPQTGP